MVRPLLTRLLPPHLDWIQVEITTSCNCLCIYCPSAVGRASLEPHHMRFESFKKLVPSFRNASMVHLQGWGEPLLHPDFFAMATLAKEADCLVGTTTNGMLLDADTICRILDTGIDLISVSLAGASRINDAVREGSEIQQILQSIRRIDRAKKERGLEKPIINIAYMLLRSHISELRKLPEILRGCGVCQIVISTLDFVPVSSLQREVVSESDSDGFEQLLSLLQEVDKACTELGIAFHCPVTTRATNPTCAENAQNALFVAADGSVSPCVYANLRLEGLQALRRAGVADRLTFGNIHEETLSEIWWKSPYRRFRNSLFTTNPPQACRNCPKLGRY